MIVYEIPQLHCECGFVMVELDKNQQPKIGGRILFRCGNESCRYHNVTHAFRLLEHKLELV